jgi:hypothetical protein
MRDSKKIVLSDSLETEAEGEHSWLGYHFLDTGIKDFSFAIYQIHQTFILQKKLEYQSIALKKTVWKWFSIEEIHLLNFLQTQKLYNLYMKMIFKASVQAYYDSRRRSCLNRVAKLE